LLVVCPNSGIGPAHIRSGASFTWNTDTNGLLRFATKPADVVEKVVFSGFWQKPNAEQLKSRIELFSSGSIKNCSLDIYPVSESNTLVDIIWYFAGLFYV